MQKKSLLVALFCGALCLTGCLKNEESASVAQVRIAKANELNSIADLNKAKAQAEVIYANAEATIAQAEAKLREANAALILAQAETEKVRAELLKVQVEMAEVLVDEERVKLELLQADLEKHLAEVEAAVAKAEAEKQGWINVLNHAIAAAEEQALKDAKAILDAQDALEKAVLTMAKAQADSAKKAATKYFAALDEVQGLQKEMIVLKAEKAMVEAGALEIRDALHYQLGRVNEDIAKKEARIAYLKQYQTASPEEIKAEMEEAWKDVNDAYALYLAAVEASKDAETAKTDAAGVKSTYVENWNDNFGQTVKDVLEEIGAEYAQYKRGSYSKYVFVDEETGVKYNALVTFDEETGEVSEIVPLWTASGTDLPKEQYFDEPVFPATIEGIYQKYPKMPSINVSDIQNRTYYPAKIEFDNIQEVFDAYKEYQEEVVLPKFDDAVADYVEFKKEGVEDYVDGLKVAKEYFEDYVAGGGRAAMVEKAEKAFEDSIAVANKTHGNFEKAWNAYRDYMVMKYDVSRTYFEERYNAQQASDNADADSVSWGKKLAQAKSDAKEAWGDLEEAELLAHNKAGAYNAAKKAQSDARSEAKIEEARKKFNEKFDPKKDTVWVGKDLYNNTYEGTTPKTPKVYDSETKAGSTQVAVAAAAKAMKDAENELRDAQWMNAYWTGYGDSAKAAEYDVEALKTAYNGTVTTYNDAVKAAAAAEKITKTATSTEETEAVKNARLAYEAAYKDLYEGTADNRTTYDVWYAAVKDTLVKDTTFVSIPLNFYERGPIEFNVEDGGITNENADRKDVADPDNTTYKVYTTAQKAAWFAHQHTVKANALKDAEAALLAQLAAKQNVDPEDITSTADAKADELYVAMLKAFEEKDASKNTMDAALAELLKVYYYCADQDYRDWFENEMYWANAKYQLDPEYQLIYGYEWDAENETYVAKKWYRKATWDNDLHKFVGDRKQSVAAMIEDAEAMLADKETFAEDCKEEFLAFWHILDPHDAYKAMCDKIDKATENLAKYKAVEKAYVASVNDRNTTHAAWVEAKLEEMAADILYKIAREDYLALKDVANEGIWVYDPDQKIKTELGTTEGVKHEAEFTFVPIANAIKLLEGDTKSYYDAEIALYELARVAWDGQNGVISATDKEISLEDVRTILNAFNSEDAKKNFSNLTQLNLAKKLLEKTLQYGKLALEVFIDAYDEEIAELDEKIDVYSAIADAYKAIMNYYLGIVDEAVVDDETGPLEGEGEGEEA